MRRRVTAVATAALIIVAGITVPAVAAHAATMTLTQLEAQLTIAGQNYAGYDLSLFGGWTTTANGCDTRNTLLKEQTIVPVTFSTGCTVETGWWNSWYDSQQIADAPLAAIDHLVPLAEAWSSGASAWTAAQRNAFNNDTAGDELQIVSPIMVQQQGDSDPSGWVPVSNQAKCPYITHWILEKYRWSLTVDPTEQAAIAGYLAQNNCGAQGVPVPTVQVPPTAPTANPLAMPVYRFLAPGNQTHFYTVSAAERDEIIADYPQSVWTYEGYSFNAFITQLPGTVPEYRFYSAKFGGHFYTTSISERDGLIAAGDTFTWNYEGIAYYVYPLDSTVADTVVVARFWSPTYAHHFYTASATEAAAVKRYPAAIWSYEGDAFRVPTPAPSLELGFELTICSSGRGVPIASAYNPNSFAVTLSIGYDSNGDGSPDSGESTRLIPPGVRGFQWSTTALENGVTGTVIMKFGTTIVYSKAFVASCPVPPPA